MKSRLLSFLLALVLCVPAGHALAVFDPVNDDTDLFRNNPNIPAERPNVLIILDNTANWNTAFTNEKAAFIQVVNSLDSAFNVGWMMYPETGGGNDNIDGAYVRFAMRQMTSTNKAALASIISSFDKLADKGNNSTLSLAMYESWLYFGGRASRASYGKVKTDFTGSTANSIAGSLPGNALPANPTAASLYNAAIGSECQKNYIIYISNGPANENASALSTSQTLLTAARGGSAPSVIAISPNGMQNNWADEYAQFMAGSDINGNLTGVQTAITYTVEIDPGTQNQDQAMTALMKSMANQGKGKYFAVTSAGTGQAIVDALTAIFTEIQAVNSVFAASTLPVSVNVRGTNLNQLYIGVFRPDSKDLPRWLGNLKAYQLKKDPTTGAVFTVDANGVAAINSSTGFITSSAVSFWTSPSLPTSNYWAFRSSSANGVGGSSDSPDGDLVEKGGAAQQVRGLYFGLGVNGTPTRPIYTCTNGTGLCAVGSSFSATPFATSNSDIDAASLSLSSRSVTPLSALVTLPVTALADTRLVSLSNATGGGVNGTLSVSNSTAVGVTLSNSRSVAITAMNNGAVSVTGTCSKSSNNVGLFTFSGVTLPNNPTIAVTVGTADSKFATTSTLATTASATTLTWPITGLGNPSPASGTCTLTTSNTTTIVTAPSHGFALSPPTQTVTVAGASPAQYSGTKTITVTDANTFTFSNTVSVAPTLSSATATGSTSTVTVTKSSGSFTGGTFSAGQQVTIAGAAATTPSYNGTFTILSSPAPTSTTFAYTTSSAITTAASGTITAAQTASVATVTTLVPHLFTDGLSITLTGASPAGYNGSYVISCTPSPACLGATTFTYTPGAGLGAPTVTSVVAASGTGAAVTATLANHGYVAGDTVTIASAGSALHNGSFTIDALPAPTATTFNYTNVAGAGVAPGGSPTVRKTTNPLAYATIVGHGYGANGATVGNFSILGASPSGYNVSNVTATIVDTDTVSYVLPAAQGTATVAAVTATTFGTTATAVSTAHGYTTGDLVTISGASPSAFNGSQTITVTGADSFTYPLGSPQGAASGIITVTSSGGSTSERDLVINWVRGEDNFEDENANASFADTRASIHGDVLHSRPAVVNYNRRQSDTANIDNDVYIFYGGNDGVFRSVKGGFGSSAGDPAPGAEVWGFVAREHFPNLRRLRINSPGISSSYKKPYFFDGSIGTYTLDSNNDGKLVASDGDKVWMFLTMRRGGRFIYALDVSDPLTPKLLWRKGCPSYDSDPAKVDAATGCDLGFGELGQTWSEPKVLSINASTDPVLMFGAGYDATPEDLDPVCISGTTTTTVTTNGANGALCSSATTNRSMGRGLYVVNARTGDLIWQAAGHARTDGSTHPYKQVSGMDFSIPSDIAVVVGDPTPKPFRAYVGDTGANMWRIDFGDANPVNWTVAKLAAVGDQTTAAGRRKFQFAPDVVGAVGYDVVISGTGDREHPFDTTIVNRVYAFKDTRQTNPAFVSGSQVQATITHADTVLFNGSTIKALLDVTTNCIQIPANCSGTAPELAVSGTSASLNTSTALAVSSNEGWFITLAAGEKQVGSTLAAGSGAVVFGTNQPSAAAGGGACAPNLGVAKQYAVNFADGTAFSGTSVSTTYAGGGYLPSPVLVYVGLGGATGTGTATSGGVPVGGTISGGQIKIGAGAGLGGGNDPTGVVCYGASCSLAPGKQLYSRLRKFWFKEID